MAFVPYASGFGVAGANWMVPFLFAFAGAEKTGKANGMGVQFLLALPGVDSLSSSQDVT
jgi:hypothetical protein